ncbi:beta-catenin 1, partial [Brachionus plicatilis]
MKIGNLEHLTEKERLEVLKMLESEPEVEPFTEASLRKLLTQFEKKFAKNQEMRIKYPDNPEKFMDSEIELNQVLQEMHAVSTRPDFYPILLESNFLQSLLSLINHENIDISAAVISLLQELTDLESSMENLEEIKSLIDYLFEQQVFSLLISNFDRLDETNKDESEAVHNTLAIFENIIEAHPSLCVESSKQGLLAWLLKRIKFKGPFDSNKLYAAELLSILVQNHDENRKLVGEMDGIDILLLQIAYYKKHNPASAEEYEYMENLFDCLCSCLMLPANRLKFLQAEGLQLMRLILREQKNARHSALKVLSYAMNNLEGKENCQAFVEMLGLGILFPLFMKPADSRKKKNKENYNYDEYIVSIVSSLLKNCSDDNKKRVIGKFVENDHEKIDRLLELYFKYSEQVDKVKFSDEEEEEDKADELYLKKLENGLFALQAIVYIIMDIYINGQES